MYDRVSLLQRLAREMESMSRKLADAERDHEAEVMKRSDYENRIKTIQKELSLQAQVHKKVSTTVELVATICCMEIHTTGIFLLPVLHPFNNLFPGRPG